MPSVLGYTHPFNTVVHSVLGPLLRPSPQVVNSAVGAISNVSNQLNNSAFGALVNSNKPSGGNKPSGSNKPSGGFKPSSNGDIGSYYDRVYGVGVRPWDGPSGAGAPSGKGIDYLYADLAKHYGFSKETAYQEALANTQYSRAVADMQRAGLNPAAIYGSGKGYTAGDDIWPTSSNGGGGGGGYSRRSSGSGGKSSGKFFSTSAYSVLSAMSGIVGAIATKSPSGYWIGTSLAQGAMNAVDAISKWGR